MSLLPALHTGAAEQHMGGASMNTHPAAVLQLRLRNAGMEETGRCTLLAEGPGTQLQVSSQNLAIWHKIQGVLLLNKLLNQKAQQANIEICRFPLLVT